MAYTTVIESRKESTGIRRINYTNMKKFLISLSLICLVIALQATHLTAQSVEDPDPLRFEKQIEEFRQWDLRNATPDSPVLFVGSSSIRLWRTASAFPDYPVINRGFGGSHLSDVLYYYDDLFGPYEPAVVVFYEGDNDVASGKPADQVLEDYNELISRLLSDHPDTQFIYLPIKPSPSRWHHWETMAEVNRRIKEINSEDPRLHYVDLATPMFGSDGIPDASLLLDDQLHLNEDGYEVWNRILEPELARISGAR